MTKITQVTYAFVDSAPATLAPGTIYISAKYRAIVHLCLCGCTEKVLLNLEPDAWRFTFDGRTISICPSVGNVGIPCRSHYIVHRSRVKWLPPLFDLDPETTLRDGRQLQQHEEAAWRRGIARWLPWRRTRPSAAPRGRKSEADE